MTPRPFSWRALFETLRAPLLLSPLADVAAGWTVAAMHVTAIGDGGDASALRILANDLFRGGLEAALPFLLAATAGCCLLASGMAQNALADLPEDREHKPDRPLPRGDVSPGVVRVAHLGGAALGLGLAGLISPGALIVAAAVVTMTWLYHVGAKRLRIPGCVLLGALRASVVLLGMAALATLLDADRYGGTLRFDTGAGWTWGVPLLYGLYIFGASLHASTDDAPGGKGWSTVGLTLCCAVLLGQAGVIGLQAGWFYGWYDPEAYRHLAAGLFLIAGVRLGAAWTGKPPPAVTGVALSNLYIYQAAVCVAVGGPVPALLCGLLFAASRLMLRSFPPS